MKVKDFKAEADIVGQRIRISWTFEPEGSETVADVPQVRLRRKLRDFEFPPPAAVDPFLVYDSTAFPPVPVPGVIDVTELPGWEVLEADGKHVYSATSVAGYFFGRRQEIMRRTVATTFDEVGMPVSRWVEILDQGGQPFHLEPGRTYYYDLSGLSLPLAADANGTRSTAIAGEHYGWKRDDESLRQGRLPSSHRLYDLLPAIYKRQDTVLRPVTAGSDSVPEAASGAGQLRRFVDVFGAAVDSLRGSAENLLGLLDLDEGGARFLPLLARWIGWNLSQTEAIPLHRNEIKSAPRLYWSIGTAPALRTIVTRYSGWSTQVAEFAQHIARSNHAPYYHILLTVQQSGGPWGSPADAARVLGFGDGNREANGTGSAPAVLTGTVAEPFRLQPGMEIEIGLDGESPVKLRFAEADFADLSAVRAEEVATVINARLPYVRAGVTVGGMLTLSSTSVGPEAAISVEASHAGLISLEGAPAGRLSAFVDQQGHLRLFYEMRDRPGPTATSLEATSAGSPARQRYSQSRIHYKTYVVNEWRDSLAAPIGNEVAQGRPSCVELADGRVWLAWVEAPDTARSCLRIALGTPAPEQPAKLCGRRSGPFPLTPGTVLTLKGNWPTESFTVNAGDYANPTLASTAEVVAAINSQLSNVMASPLFDGSLALETLSKGPTARLEVDLSHSTAARSLGFAEQSGAQRGSWNEEIQWSVVQEVPELRPGRHTDPAAVRDPAGGIRLFWSEHRERTWHLSTLHWDECYRVATAGGVSIFAGGVWSTITMADGLPHDDVRAVAVDAEGSAWYATAGGAARRRPDGTWLVVDIGSGLSSNDIRSVAVGPDGLVWLASGAGVDVFDPAGGTITTYTAGSGLVDNDVRVVAVERDGGAWFATAAGLSFRTRYGQWQSFDSSDFLPSDDVRSVTFGTEGSVWVATANGIAQRDTSGGWKIFREEDGLPGNDARALAVAQDGALWVATAAGLGHRDSSGTWRQVTATSGLAGNDVRCVTVGPDGTVWVGTPEGLSVRSTAGTWTHVDQSAGLADDGVRAVHGPWSAPLELAAGDVSHLEPCAVVDDSDRTWLFWSREQEPGSGRDHWLVQRRVYNPASWTWEPEQAVTTTPASGRASDREPMAMTVSGSGPRVFFSSDRGGGRNLWWVDLNAAGTASAPAGLTESPAIRRAPAAVTGSDGSIRLFYRSDGNLPLSQLGTGQSKPSSPFADMLRSEFLGNAATLRRNAGTTSARLLHLARNVQRRMWGDLLCYTPQKPRGNADQPLQPDELYTRGTLGLYVSRGRFGRPLTRPNVDRLNQLLSEFLPINMRAVIILVPSVYTEYVYGDGHDIEEMYRDLYPNVEVYTGLVDRYAAALPDWMRLLSNMVDHVSADPTDLTTLRRRTYFPKPQ